MALCERYLGDGVYASSDGHYIWLDPRGQDDTTRIALEPSTLRELIKFKADLPTILQGGTSAES